MPAPYLFICLLPTEQGRFVPQQPRFPGDDRDSWIVARPGWREAGRPTCFVSGFGDHRFSTGPAQSLPTRLGHAALAVADDGGSGT
jgi:hypothetical protein